jgi:hypothetical protein
VRPLVAVLAALVLLAAAPAVAGAATVIGISDSDANTFVDPSWPGLRVTTARAVVPYDVALTRPVAGTPAGDARMNFDAWVANAAGAGVRPLVVFQTSFRPHPAAPSPAAYGRAVRAFLRTYPSVRMLAPWNEPNFQSAATANPLIHNPTLAARYYLVLRSTCPACTVPAGEMAGIPGDPYLGRYQRALGSVRPRLWSFHAHTDANQFQAGTNTDAPATRYFLRRLGGSFARSKIWIDEIGAYFRDENGKVWGDPSQQQTTSFILGLASLSPRIVRIYYYNLSNQCSDPSRCAVQDRGLVSPQPFDVAPGAAVGYDVAGRVRPAYGVIAARGPIVTPGPQA